MKEDIEQKKSIDPRILARDQFARKLANFAHCQEDDIKNRNGVIAIGNFPIDPEDYTQYWPLANEGKFNSNLEVIYIGPADGLKKITELQLETEDFADFVKDKYHRTHKRLVYYSKRYNIMLGEIGEFQITDEGVVIQPDGDSENLLLKSGFQSDQILVIRSVLNSGSINFLTSHVFTPPKNFRSFFNPLTGILLTESEMQQKIDQESKSIIKVIPETTDQEPETIVRNVSKLLQAMRVTTWDEGNIQVRVAKLGDCELPVKIWLKENHGTLPNSTNRYIKLAIEGIALPHEAVVDQKYAGNFPLGILKKADIGRPSGRLIFEINQIPNHKITLTSRIERPDNETQAGWWHDHKISTTDFNSLPFVYGLVQQMKPDMVLEPVKQRIVFTQADQLRKKQEREKKEQEAKRRKSHGYTY
jgi:hypothetical protein